MIKTKNFKEGKDGKYRIKISNEVKDILSIAVSNYLMYAAKPHEFFLAEELIEALEQQEIKLWRSEFFLLFSYEVQRFVPETTQNYIAACLDIDEVKRQMVQQKAKGMYQIHRVFND